MYAEIQTVTELTTFVREHIRRDLALNPDVKHCRVIDDTSGRIQPLVNRARSLKGTPRVEPLEPPGLLTLSSAGSGPVLRESVASTSVHHETTEYIDALRERIDHVEAEHFAFLQEGVFDLIKNLTKQNGVPFTSTCAPKADQELLVENIRLTGELLSKERELAEAFRYIHTVQRDQVPHSPSSGT